MTPPTPAHSNIPAMVENPDSLPNAFLSLRDVSKVFPRANGGGTNRVLRDIHLEIEAGEFVTVVGPSGCGKSTLLNGIAGFIAFTTGRAMIDGSLIGKPDRDRGIVFQDHTVPDFLTTRENIGLGLLFEDVTLWEHFTPFRMSRALKKHRGQIDELLNEVGLIEHADKYPRQLSGGQKQRVAIAQALAMQPKILLMDEPFSALDPQTRQSLQKLVLRIQRKTGTTIIFVTHELEEAVFLGDRIIVLSQLIEAIEGAKIVLNQKVPEFDSPEAKLSPEFQSYKRMIWEAGFIDRRPAAMPSVA